MTLNRKKALSTLSKLTKTLEDEQIHPSNKNNETTNYIYSLKSKMTKPSKQRRKKRIKKRSDNKREKKKQEVGKCKTYREKHQRDC